jgi:alkyl hydroperoxide reductase subunit F
VSYCATCDIPYFRGKTVALVGDDTSSVETAYELAQQAKRVYLFTSFDSDAPRTNNVRIIVDAKIEKILGSNQVTGIIYTDNASGESVQLAVEGVFIESDAVGNSLLVRHAVDTSPAGFITVDHVTMATSAAGIFAAGDVTNGDYKQVVFAMADGAKAALSVKKYVNVKEIV